MFGISLTEIMVIAVIALVVVGPQKLPGMLRTVGQWIRKLRRLTTEVRAQTGIDDILREEGIDGVHELRSLLRGEIAAARRRPTQPKEDPYLDALEFDEGREYPVEGADSYGAMPDDLIENDEDEDEDEDEEPAEAQSQVTANAEPSAPVQPSAGDAPRPKPLPAPLVPPRPTPTKPKPPEVADGSEPAEVMKAGSLTSVAASPQKTS